MEFLLRKGADIDRREKGESALDKAAKSGHVNVVRYLLNQKKGSYLYKNREGEVALHWAAKFGRVKVVNYLLRKGFGVNDRDGTGKTALHMAVESGHMDVIDQSFISRSGYKG